MDVTVSDADIQVLANRLQVAVDDAYRQGQQAERERIRARAKLAAEKTWKDGDWYIGPQHNMIEKFVDALLEDGGATHE